MLRKLVDVDLGPDSAAISWWQGTVCYLQTFKPATSGLCATSYMNSCSQATLKSCSVHLFWPDWLSAALHQHELGLQCHIK